MGHRVEPLDNKTYAAVCDCCPLRPQNGGDCVWPGPLDEPARASTQIALEPNDLLFESGAESRSYWIVKSGFLRVVHYSQEGRRHVVTLLQPTEVAGFVMPMVDGLIIEAASKAVVCKVDRRQFMHRMAEDGTFRRSVYLQETRQLERLRWLIWAIGGLSPEERLAAFFARATLFMPCEPQEDGSVILTMQVSRADLSDLLNTTAETISRVTHKMQDSGWIEILDAARFRIIDLKAIAGMGRVPISTI